MPTLSVARAAGAFLLALLCFLSAARSHAMRKRHRPRWDSDEAIAERVLRWPPGPSTREELHRWPATNAAALCNSAARACRLRANTLRRICVYSDYSGMCSEKEALLKGFSAIKEHAGWGDTGNPFEFDRVCDIGVAQLKILCGMSKDAGGTMCVLKDVLNRLHPIAHRHLHGQLPPADSDKQTSAAAFSSMLDWLLANRSWALPLDTTQRCLVHQADCAVHPVKKRGREKLGSSESDDEVMHLHFAGVTCDGWSTIGKQQRFGHISEMAHNCYLVERVKRAEDGCEDIAFVECTQNYPFATKVQSILSKTHTTVSVVTGPELFGHPVHRRRVMGASINKARYAWVGPESAAAVEVEFSQLFYRAVTLSGGVYFAAPEQSRLQMYEALAAGQTNHVSQERIQAMTSAELFPLVLSSSQHHHLQQWLQDREAWESSDGELVVDLEHNLQERRRGGHLWPTQLTHGMLAHLPRGNSMKLATPMEHLEAQGFHIFGEPGDAVSPMGKILEKFSINKCKELVGRGVHITVLSAWMFYVLSNIVRIHRPPSAKMLRGLTFTDPTDAEEKCDSDDPERQQVVATAATADDCRPDDLD